MSVTSFLIVAWILVSPPTGTTNRLQNVINERLGNHRGAAVVLDVVSGRILASYHIDVAARRLAVPGSTVKPFTLMALFSSGLLTEETGLVCPRKLRLGTHILDCSHRTLPGPMDPVLALAYSCNYFFATMAGGLAFDRLSEEFSRDGLASVTGKWPTEIAGSVQEPKSVQELQLMSIGEQGVRVTPLALAEAYRVLILPLRDSRTVSRGLRLVLKGMESVVSTGTGQLAASKNVQVAGKTGTAGGHAWFVGFAPAERPEIVTVVFLEQGTGGKDAAPIAGRIFDTYFEETKAGQ